MAARAGVSVGTVSNVLNRPDLVAAPTRERVRTAMEELGFVRNESARMLRAGTSRTIGLIVLDVTNPFFTDVARGVEDAAVDAGLAVILCNSDDDPGKETRYVELLAEQRVQGILIVPAAATTRKLPMRSFRGIPTVFLDYATSSTKGCSVSVDDVAGGRIAASHLLDAGHTSLAFVGGGPSSQVADRLRGARLAVAEHRRRARLLVVDAPTLNVDGGRAAGRALLDMRGADAPSAAFCANDLLALGVLQEMGRARVTVPGTISIVGYDDILFAAAAAVPLTSVRQPRHELGRVAAGLLLEETTDPSHRHRHVVFEPELVVRSSSGPRRSGSGAGPRTAPS